MINPIPNSTSPTKTPDVPKDIHALILDDSQFDRAKIRRLFRTSGLTFNLDEVESLDDLETALDRENYDVILIDYNLPKGNGIEALQLVQQHAHNATAAKILITGDDQSQVAVNAMKMGCQDYISKHNLSAEQLKSSIQSAIVVSELATAEAQNRAKNTEDLTQLIMAKYSQALQPEIANIVRDMRRLKASMSNPNSNLPGDLEAIEKKCIGLWAILTDPEEVGLGMITVPKPRPI